MTPFVLVSKQVWWRFGQYLAARYDQLQVKLQVQVKRNGCGTCGHIAVLEGITRYLEDEGNRGLEPAGVSG